MVSYALRSFRQTYLTCSFLLISRPTGEETLLFDQWLERAYKAENASKDEPHFYLQLNSVGPNAYVYALRVWLCFIVWINSGF